MRLVGKTDICGRQNDGQCSGTKPCSTNVAGSRKHVIGTIGRKRVEGRHVPAVARIELRGSQSRGPAICHSPIVVTVKSQPGDNLIQGLDISLRTIATETRSHPIQRGLN